MTCRSWAFNFAEGLSNGAYLGADRDRVHPRLRNHRADQLRPRRRVHDRLLHPPSASGRTLGLGLTTGALGLVGGLLVTLIIAMIVTGSLNVLIERVAYRPLRAAPKLASLITRGTASRSSCRTSACSGAGAHRRACPT